MVLVAVVTLWRLQLQAVPSATSDLAVHPGAAAGDQMLIANQLASALPLTIAQPDDQNTTAVLFLIDESGGVSGRCDAVNPSDVFDTDPQGRRYELVRFYLQLWRAYHAFLRDREELDLASPLIQMGVMQFARENEPQVFLSVTPIGDLIDDLGATKFAQLQSQDTMLTEIDANWFCWTNFSSALDGAAEGLNNSGAEKKILVLLTDGSTRGNENEEECDESDRTCFDARLATRSTAREATEQALRRLKASNIEPLVVIWQGNDCIEENTCELSPNEFTMRKDDLARWQSWEQAGLLTLIDDQPIKKLAETPAFVPLMPGNGRFVTGWMDGTNEYTVQQQIPAVTQNLTTTIVTSRDTDDGNFQAGSLIVRRFRPQWFQGVASVTAAPGEFVCRSRNVRIEIDDELQSTAPFVAYYWLVSDQGWPKIQSVEVQPNPVVVDRLEAGQIPSSVREIAVTVKIDPQSNPYHPECYRVDMEAGPVKDFKIWDNHYGPLTFRAELPEDIPYGPLPITATLVFADEPEKLAAAPRTISGQVVYLPVLPQKIDISAGFSVTTSKGLTVTVPITFAERIPGFAVRFGLFQDQFDPQEPFPTPPAPTVPTTEPTPTQGCPPTSGLDNAVEYLGDIAKATGSANNLVTTYSFVIKDYEHALMACKYRTLLVEWIRSSNGQDASDQAVYQWITIVGVPEQPTEPPVEPRLVLIWREIVAWFRDLFASKQAR